MLIVFVSFLNKLACKLRILPSISFVFYGFLCGSQLTRVTRVTRVPAAQQGKSNQGDLKLLLLTYSHRWISRSILTLYTLLHDSFVSPFAVSCLSHSMLKIDRQDVEYVVWVMLLFTPRWMLTLVRRLTMNPFTRILRLTVAPVQATIGLSFEF